MVEVSHFCTKLLPTKLNGSEVSNIIADTQIAKRDSGFGKHDINVGAAARCLSAPARKQNGTFKPLSASGFSDYGLVQLEISAPERQDIIH